MTEFKGTKGKWMLGVTNMINMGKCVTISKHFNKEDKGPYEMVCVVSPVHEFTKEDHANALLISKAPEMLQMLKMILNIYPIVIEEDKEILKEIKQLIKEATEL